MAQDDFIGLLRQIAGATAGSRDLLAALRRNSEAAAPQAGAFPAAPSDGMAKASLEFPRAPAGDAGQALRERTADWREHTAALALAGQAYDDLGRIAGALPPELARLADLGQSFGHGLSDALGDVLLRGQGVLETLQGLDRQLLKMLTERLVLAPLQGGFDNLFGSVLGGAASGIGGGLLAGLGGLAGFAHGGRFRVGGSGGPDSMLVPLRLSPGELVEVAPASAAGAARPSAPVTLNINVRVSSELGQGDGFRATGRQVAQDLARRLVPVLQTL
jgi:hypothetical protein